MIRSSLKNYILTNNLVQELKNEGIFFALDYRCIGMVMTEKEIVISFNNTISYLYEYAISCKVNYLCEL